MAKTYTHLTLGERERIHFLRRNKCSIGFIASALGRSKSTISDELSRHRHGGGYEAARADAKARAARKMPRRQAKMDVPAIADYVKDSLMKEWSPEQISGRMRVEHGRSKTMRISHESIYAWIRREKKRGGEWYKHLRLDNRKRKKPRAPKLGSSARIANRRMLDERPRSVAARLFVGDWEGDTIEGKRGCGRLASLVERKTRYTVIARVASKHSEKLTVSLCARFSRSPWLPMRTLTVDNGLEFAGHEELGKALGGKVYFAHPYSSWERGLNENTNGLLRQYFPKGTDFLSVPEERIAVVEERLNTRPRKILGYRTPAEVMTRSLWRSRGVRLVT